MLETRITFLLQQVKTRFDSWFAGRYWDWKFAFFLMLGVWLWSFPSYQYFIQPEASCLKNWQALELQFQNPFQRIEGQTTEHFTQARYRILLPVIGWLTGISPKTIILLLPFAGILFFRHILKSLQRIFESKSIAALISFGLATTYVGRSFTTDVIGYFDAFAFLAIGSVLFSNNTYVVLAGCLGAFILDERSILVSPLIVHFIWMRQSSDLGIFESVGGIRFPLIPVLFAIVLTFTIRLGMSHFFAFGSVFPDSELVGFGVLRDNYQDLPLLWLTGIGFFWISIFIPAFYSSIQFSRTESVLFSLYLISGFILCQTVLDVTRSISYFFPGILTGHLLVYRNESRFFFKRYLSIITLFSFLLPPLFAIGTSISWQGPVIPKILKIMWMWMQT